MFSSLDGGEGGFAAPFCLGVLMLLLLPCEGGYQDLAGFIARQPPLVQPAQKAALASPFGTIHEARFAVTRPMGASIPARADYTLIGLDPNHSDLTASIGERILDEGANGMGPVFNRAHKRDYRSFRTGERSLALKGDRLPTAPTSPVRQVENAQLPQAEKAQPPSAATQVTSAPPAEAPPSPSYTLASIATERATSAAQAAPLVTVKFPANEEGGVADPSRPLAGGIGFASAEVDPALHAARLYFGVDPMGQRLASLEPWAPGEEPMLDNMEEANEGAMSLAALPGGSDDDALGLIKDSPVDRADLPPLHSRGGQTVAPKGEVTGVDGRPMSPAERLGLDEKARAKEEKCLAEVIYFEARGEHVRGQMAVAQVVLNRAFSGRYPSTVCGVVYQNAHRRLACQFTFACDGIPDVVREPDMWERAQTIAAEMLDGKLWLPEVGKATHYHASWVRPGWVRQMTKLQRLGVHTFYRPRAWGDGGDAPEWGDAAATEEAARKLVEAAKKL